MDRPECARCGEVFGEGDALTRVASISGSIMGDEYTDSYFLCSRCGLYTVGHYHDRFSGIETVVYEGSVERAEGDRMVALIRRCPKPYSKRCRCEAHREYFGGALD